MRGSVKIFPVVILVMMVLVMVLAYTPTTTLADTDEPSPCLSCHAQKTPEIVRTWRASSHAHHVDCKACHDQKHDGNMAKRARRHDRCTTCHADVATHSYITSKHGVITTLEHTQWDLSQPLEEGNYRAPTCAYCHMHQGNHNVSRFADDIEAWRMEPCFDCHTPRFVTTWFSSGEQMIAIGRMKVQEATKQLFNTPESVQNKIRKQLSTMESVHLKNIRLGVHHQSPDYQWWHGHPALDGDLLRIKDSIWKNLRFLLKRGTVVPK